MVQHYGSYAVGATAVDWWQSQTFQMFLYTIYFDL